MCCVLLCCCVQNIVVKKSVVEVTGALTLMELVGYRTVELKGHPYIAIDDAAGINNVMLQKAIKLLLQYQERQVQDMQSQQPLNTPPSVLSPLSHHISSHLTSFTADQLPSLAVLLCVVQSLHLSPPALV